MRTTLVIDDTVMTRLKEEAARQGTTLSALAEAALRSYLFRLRKRFDLPPLPTFDGGPPLVDVADRDALDAALAED